MMHLRVHPKPIVKPKITLRRPPDDFLELLSKQSHELEALINQIESHPLFRQLVSAGVVQKVCFRSFAMEKQLGESAIKWLSNFLKKYGVEKHLNWQDDFFSPDAMSRIDELAKKYSIPEPKVRRALKLISQIFADERRGARRTGVPDEGEQAEPVLIYANLSEEMAQVEAFVEKYGVTEHDFVRFYEGEVSPEELCRRYGCSVPEVRNLVDCIRRIQVHEMFVQSVAVPVKPLPERASGVAFEVVAHVSVRGDGTLSIQFRDEHLYSARYVIDEERLRAFTGFHRDEEVNHIVNMLRYINRWRSLLARVVWAVCYHQRRFILTGDEAMLKPLPQAEVARELGHHRSHICRVIRYRGISTPHGKYPLSYLCASKERAIQSIAERYPDWSDRQIAEFIFVTHGQRIPRRTVSYHRAKMKSRAKAHRKKSG